MKKSRRPPAARKPAGMTFPRAMTITQPAKGASSRRPLSKGRR